MHQKRKSGRVCRNEPSSDGSCCPGLVRIFENLARGAVTSSHETLGGIDLTTRIPHPAFLEAMGKARTRVGSTVGLRAACSSSSGAFGVLEYLLRTSKTPLEGVQSVAK